MPSRDRKKPQKHLRHDKLVCGHFSGHEANVESQQLHDGEPCPERE